MCPAGSLVNGVGVQGLVHAGQEPLIWAVGKEGREEVMLGWKEPGLGLQ